MRYGEQDADTFRLLFVCTGNICRSPFAQILTGHLLQNGLGARDAARFAVSSAGTNAVVGAQMHHDTRDELMPWRLDGAVAGLFSARQLRSSMIVESDLILGATPGHRGAVVERVPEARQITFSMREFARLARAIDPFSLPDEPVKRARTLVEQARLHRGLVPAAPNEDRIPDPMGSTHQAHHDAAVLIFEAARDIVGRLVPQGR
jgi:protein-tyrosine phosphatase